MRLAGESLLSYQGISGMDGLEHVRLYKAPGQLPLVIAGQLDDNPGSPLGVAIEMVAASIQAALFGDGREFRLIQYEPDNKFGPARILEVRFAHRPTGESPGDPAHYTGETIVLGPSGETLVREFDDAKAGDFRDPVWELVEDLDGLLGCAAQTWARGEYTTLAVAGPAGEALREQLHAKNRVTADRVGKMLGG
jgi:hypothetical protein